MDLEKLPKKRGGSGVLILNKVGEILLLELMYKDDWEIPGGIIEDNESPQEACTREIKEEIGLNLNIRELLCLEYQREQDDSYMFVFDGGIQDEKILSKIVLQKSEIKSFQFLSLEKIEKKVLPKMFIRIKKAYEARKSGISHYYETIY